MNKLETVWDSTSLYTGGQSIVQKFWDTCLKYYPEEFWVTDEVLKIYVKFQNSLPTFHIHARYSDTTLSGIKEIVLSFVKLSEISSPISFVREDDIGISTEIWFVSGVSLKEHRLWGRILTDIKAYFECHENKSLCILPKFLYPENFKITSIDDQKHTVHIVCTDCGSDIPEIVNVLLNLWNE